MYISYRQTPSERQKAWLCKHCNFTMGFPYYIVRILRTIEHKSCLRKGAYSSQFKGIANRFIILSWRGLSKYFLHYFATYVYADITQYDSMIVTPYVHTDTHLTLESGSTMTFCAIKNFSEEAVLIIILLTLQAIIHTDTLHVWVKSPKKCKDDSRNICQISNIGITSPRVVADSRTCQAASHDWLTSRDLKLNYRCTLN